MNRLFGIGRLAVAMVAGLGLMASCGENDRSVKSDGMTFATFSHKTLAMGKDADSIKAANPDYSGLWEITADGVIPVSACGHNIKALCDTVMALASVKEGVDGKIRSRLPDYLVPEVEKTDTTKVRSLMMSKISVNLLTPEVLVMQVFTYSYAEGAAHGVYANTYVNYDVAKGKVLSLSDIFTPGFEKYVLPAILEQLKADGNLIVDADKVKVPDNFRITEEGVEFVFGLYAVAPYSSGEPRVGFYTSDIEDILTPEGKALLTD